MRLWSIHPKYLDRLGLLAVWREGLLAQKVLSGKTKGYTKHPQLGRFQTSGDDIGYISKYLSYIAKEAEKRGYSFDVSLITAPDRVSSLLPIGEGQLLFEFYHLQKKLKQRAPDKYLENKKVTWLRQHPLFVPVSGGVAEWEKGGDYD